MDWLNLLFSSADVLKVTVRVWPVYKNNCWPPSFSQFTQILPFMQTSNKKKAIMRATHEHETRHRPKESSVFEHISGCK